MLHLKLWQMIRRRCYLAYGQSEATNIQTWKTSCPSRYLPPFESLLFGPRTWSSLYVKCLREGSWSAWVISSLQTPLFSTIQVRHKFHRFQRTFTPCFVASVPVASSRPVFLSTWENCMQSTLWCRANCLPLGQAVSCLCPPIYLLLLIVLALVHSDFRKPQSLVY